jgi:glycosyltransferase involved in cell wall biosynthesis
MIETLVVRTFGIDVSDTEVSRQLPWKIGRLFPWLFTESAPVCFLGVGRGWRGWKKNGTFSSYALLKAIPSDGPLLYHVNRVMAWMANFIDVTRFAIGSDSSPLVVLAHTPQFGIGAALAKILFPKRLRFVVRVIGNDPSVSLLVRRSRLRFELERRLERFVLRRADVVLPMGRYTYDLSIAYGVDPKKIVVLPFPVTWLRLPKTTNLPATPTVLFCGRLIKEKGVHILLQAMELVRRRVSDAKLLIVGDTDNKAYRNELEKMVESLGMKESISFLGHIANDDMMTKYEESWVLVLPSIWEEGLGMVMVEAGLVGRAVIGSQLGGISDLVIHGENGLLVPPGDVQKLAAAITFILENRTKAVEMGNQNNVMARRYLEDFDRSIVEVQRVIYGQLTLETVAEEFDRDGRQSTFTGS